MHCGRQEVCALLSYILKYLEVSCHAYDIKEATLSSGSRAGEIMLHQKQNVNIFFPAGGSALSFLYTTNAVC